MDWQTIVGLINVLLLLIIGFSIPKYRRMKKEIADTREMLTTKIKRACHGCEYNVGNNHPMCKECLRVQWYTDNYKSE